MSVVKVGAVGASEVRRLLAMSIRQYVSSWSEPKTEYGSAVFCSVTLNYRHPCASNCKTPVGPREGLRKSKDGPFGPAGGFVQ